MRDAGLGSWPARRAAMSPGRTAMVFADRRTTYAELYERITRLVAALRAAGIRPGDRVAYLGPNHPSFVETMFATWRIGAVFVPLNVRLTEPELTYQLRHSGATALISAVPIDADVPLHLRLDDLDPLLAADPDHHAEPAGPDTAALILYTSGTTGHPKGAVLTHGNLVWNCYNLLVSVDVAGDEVTLVSAPLFHVAALNQCLLPTILKGGTSVIMPGWDVDGCFDAIARHRITWMFGVTQMFAGLSRSPRWASADLSSVRTLMTGGAPVPEALIRIFQERGLVFCQGYGMTETSPGATFLEAGESRDHIGSAGLPVFFADVRVTRPDLTPAGPGEPGEILVRGPNVTPGYWNDPAATAAAFTDGWLRSGDLAVVDGSGHLRIVDRTKDMYISGGENVYPAEVEAALFDHPAIAEAAIVGVPDDRWGEVGRAFVVPTRGMPLTPTDVREFLTGRVAAYKIPAHVDIVDDLPRTGSGKVRKGPLRARPLP
ncbi:acyl-CoA synthetase [Actinoplanes couchii]|uniref:Fatty-acyl-CoA synthase n=1 Tax=Actinoplanes couchii TaxID=403638 RepID=A0ABQ3XHU4_9ACTN|nr:long-chain fatty acid--CoA ligase [Actinoplanes couchii]MDR6317690.1 fatty-acyl-CoA synthase [Actinoplanes couchii]GID58075.1 fatty-acyl-CoA synthase [Actinoplanes couchii]